MSREKQIEEMLRDVCKLGISCNDCIAQGECVAEKYALRFYNAGYRKQEWISVDERLPEEFINVIVCDEDGTVGEALRFGGRRFEWVDNEEIAFVTHWMPLPEVPKMKGGAE